MLLAAFPSKMVVLLMLFHCLLLLSLIVFSMFSSSFVMQYLVSFLFFAIILLRKRELVNLLLYFLEVLRLLVLYDFTAIALGPSAVCDCGIPCSLTFS